MPAVSLEIADLAPFATIDATKAQAMIDDALARAARVAPCINDDDLTAVNAAAAKAIIRDVVLRRNTQGEGAIQSQQAGPFGQVIDNRQPSRALFWPSEIAELSAICAEHNEEDSSSGISSYDTVSTTEGGHSEVCALFFGADYCSCGAVLTAGLYPLYEV